MKITDLPKMPILDGIDLLEISKKPKRKSVYQKIKDYFGKPSYSKVSKLQKKCLDDQQRKNIEFLFREETFRQVEVIRTATYALKEAFKTKDKELICYNLKTIQMLCEKFEKEIQEGKDRQSISVDLSSIFNTTKETR